MSISKIFSYILISFTFLNASFGQGSLNTPKINSPYSRIGLGDFVEQEFVASATMGGMGATFHDNFHMNTINPASFGYLKSTAYELGLNSTYTYTKASTKNFDNWSGNLGYLAIGFPLKNPINQILDKRKPSKYDWGMGLSLTPYTIVGYNLQIKNYVDGIGNQTYQYVGKGGTYKINWSNALKYKDISFGVNLGYFFGKISKEQYINFDDLSGAYYNDYFTNESNVGGFIWSAGAQYDYVFKKLNENKELVPTGKRITFGLSGNLNNAITIKSAQLKERISYQYSKTNSSGSSIYSTDTIVSPSTTIKSSGNLPATINAGVNYQNDNKYKIGLQLSYSAWAGALSEFSADELRNSFKVSVGGEFIPDYISYNNYFKRIRYRYGAFYLSDPRTLNDQQMKKFGVSFGFGFPIILPRQQTSFVNLGVEVGQNAIKNSLEQTYCKISIGFTLNDNGWFYKRRYQ